MPITIVFDGGSWQLRLGRDDGSTEVGDFGTYSVDGAKLVTVSENEGCLGCEVIYRWRLQGDTLDLQLMQGSGGQEAAEIEALHTEYSYMRVDGA